jgi:hypothetical protein
MPLIVVVVRQLRHRASEIMPESVVVGLAAVVLRFIEASVVAVVASRTPIALRMIAEELRQIFPG